MPERRPARAGAAVGLGTLSHWTLLVGDLPRSSRFYQEVLGWRPAGPGAGDQSILFVRDGQRIELATRSGLQRSGPRPAVNHLGLSHLTVATGPAAPLMEELARRQVAVRRHTLDRFVPDPDDPGPTQFLFEDPDGNLVETFEAGGEQWSPFGEVGGSDPQPSATGVGHLSHWSLCVADPVRSLPFYREVLGWRELAVMEWEGEGPSRVMDVGPARLTTWLLAAGDQRVEIIHFDRPGVERRPGAGTDGPGLHRLTVQVEDLEGAAERLAAAAVPSRLEEPPGSAPVLVARDPDAIPIRFVERPAFQT